jgi:hypothetical protein
LFPVQVPRSIPHLSGRPVARCAGEMMGICDYVLVLYPSKVERWWHEAVTICSNRRPSRYSCAVLRTLYHFGLDRPTPLAGEHSIEVAIKFNYGERATHNGLRVPPQMDNE